MLPSSVTIWGTFKVIAEAAKLTTSIASLTPLMTVPTPGTQPMELLKPSNPMSIWSFGVSASALAVGRRTTDAEADADAAARAAADRGVTVAALATASPTATAWGLGFWTSERLAEPRLKAA
jgi:hypothetical protein